MTLKFTFCEKNWKIRFLAKAQVKIQILVGHLSEFSLVIFRFNKKTQAICVLQQVIGGVVLYLKTILFLFYLNSIFNG